MGERPIMFYNGGLDATEIRQPDGSVTLTVTDPPATIQVTSLAWDWLVGTFLCSEPPRGGGLMVRYLPVLEGEPGARPFRYELAVGAIVDLVTTGGHWVYRVESYDGPRDLYQLSWPD